MKKNLIPSQYKIRYASIALSIIFIYMILYEWGVFEAIPNAIIYPLKMTLPIFLLVFPITRVIKNNTYLNNFILLYFIFILWSLIPSLFGGNPEESIEQWLKFISRFIFFVVAARFLITRDGASVILMKAFVLTGLFSFMQYILVWFFQTTNLFSFSEFEMARGIYYGPGGILGNVGSEMEFPGIPSLYRFHGFWLEPSKASGFMFACYFIASNLYHLESKEFWRKSSFICLLSGFLCFSNAGYLAIAASLFFGALINAIYGKTSFIGFSFKAGIFAFLVFIAIFGRTFVANNLIDIDIARAVVGVRGGSCAGATCGGVDYSVNPSDGRLQSLSKNINIANEYPTGIGIRVTGKYDRETGFRNSGGNALIGWLVYTGYIGLLILLLRELQVLVFSMKYSKDNKSVIYLTQAWIALFIQNLLYGNIMTPAYLLIIALIFSANNSYFRLKNKKYLA